ncbi:MAG: hypothetical protein KTR32_31585 [Granulosicoccus sp.]|nr:hypothetical protein [Granulosicoccus sp.]
MEQTDLLRELELEKARLENRKLTSEIDELNRAWWKRAGYLGSVVPIIIAIVGFLTALMTGFFDTRQVNLENDIAKLESEKARIEEQTDDLRTAVNDAYLRLKIAVSEYGYAANHIRVCGQIPNDVIDSVDRSAGIFPQLGEYADQLLDCIDTVHLLIPLVAEEYTRTQTIVDLIPVEDSLKELKPVRGYPSLLQANDDRVYDLDTSRFFDNIQAYEILRQSEE